MQKVHWKNNMYFIRFSFTAQTSSIFIMKNKTIAFSPTLLKIIVLCLFFPPLYTYTAEEE